MSLPAGFYLRQNVRDFKVLLGQPVLFTAAIKTLATTAQLFIFDGTTVTYSSAHTGSGNFEVLTVSATIPVRATQVQIGVGYPQTINFSDPVWMGAARIYVEAQEQIVGAGCRYCGTINPRAKGRNEDFDGRRLSAENR